MSTFARLRRWWDSFWEVMGLGGSPGKDKGRKTTPVTSVPAPPRRTFPPVETPAVRTGGGPATRDIVVDFGTTATVVGLLNGNWPAFLIDAEPSELLIYPSGELVAGRQAIEAMRDGALDATPPAVYHTSIKRYLDVAARDARLADVDAMREMVEKYIKTVLRAGTADAVTIPTDVESVVISVPNSFNPVAVNAIRDGVIAALGALNGKGESWKPAFRILREGEAVAGLYVHRRSVPAKVAGQPFEWVVLSEPNGATPPAAKSGQAGAAPLEVLAVLDIGGGTTDLTLVESIPPNDSGRESVRMRVLQNSGIPLGGTDVDAILLGGLTVNAFRFWTLNGKDESRKYRTLGLVRDRKEGRFEDFLEPASAISLSKTMYGDTSDEVPGAEAIPLIGQRIDQLLDLSIAGLIKLIPKDLRPRISTVLLTGRASQLGRIRDALNASLTNNGISARVMTLRAARHLKLAVALGSMFTPNDTIGERLPVATFGRRLRMEEGPLRRILRNAGTIVSADLPTVFYGNLPLTDDAFPTRYKWYEDRVMFKKLDENVALSLGLLRFVARYDAPERRDIVVLWSPADDAYYVPKDGRWTRTEHQVSDSSNPDRRGENELTGLPWGFPHVHTTTP